MRIKITMAPLGKILYLKCFKCHLKSFIRGELKKARSKLCFNKSLVKYQLHIALRIKGSKAVGCYCVRRAMINLQEKSVQTVSFSILYTPLRDPDTTCWVPSVTFTCSKSSPSLLPLSFLCEDRISWCG